MTGPPLVAFTWHWQYDGVPEGRSALPHYRAAVEALAVTPRPYALLGHAHPRAWKEVAPWYDQLGIESTPNLDDVFDRADLLVADNTSALYEFASLDRPVLVLNAPWYRRDVEHGGRFWRWADVGVQVDHPDQLAGGITVALTDPPLIAQRRRQIVAEVYASADGTAAARAVHAIHSVIGAALARQATRVTTNPYAPKTASTVRGFSPRLDVHPPIPRLVYLGAPPVLVDDVRREWEGLGDDDRLKAVEMFEALTDDEVRIQIADEVSRFEPEHRTTVDPLPDLPPAGSAATVLAWVGTDLGRARAALLAEEAGRQRKRLIRDLRRVFDHG